MFGRVIGNLSRRSRVFRLERGCGCAGAVLGAEFRGRVEFRLAARTNTWELRTAFFADLDPNIIVVLTGGAFHSVILCNTVPVTAAEHPYQYCFRNFF